MKLGDKVRVRNIDPKSKRLLDTFDGHAWTVLNMDHVTGRVAVFCQGFGGAVINVVPSYACEPLQSPDMTECPNAPVQAG